VSISSIRPIGGISAGLVTTNVQVPSRDLGVPSEPPSELLSDPPSAT